MRSGGIITLLSGIISLMVHLLLVALIWSYKDRWRKTIVPKHHSRTQDRDAQPLLLNNNLADGPSNTTRPDTAKQLLDEATAPPKATVASTINLQQVVPTSTQNAFQQLAPTQEAPVTNFAQLAQGFLQAKEQVHRKKPTLASSSASANIKFERFAQKLLGAVYNSFKILQRTASIPYPPYGKTHIALELNDDGTLAKSYVQTASSNPYFDHFLLTVIQDAESIFPPLPTGLEAQTASLTLVVTVSYTNGAAPHISFSLL